MEQLLIKPVTKEVSTILNTELGKESSALMMHFVKHLNRYHVWHGHIPVWRIDTWDNGNTFKVFESKTGFNESFLAKCGFDMLKVMENPQWQKYTLIFITFDKNTGQLLSSGLSDSRSEVFETYINKLMDAINMKKLMEGEH